MKRHFLIGVFSLILLCGSFSVPALAQEESIYSFSGDAAIVSKYLWRGQRLTNDWSFQPSMTVGIGGLSLNAWGTVDLTAVNEGGGLFLPENPLAPADAVNNGLKGHFTEIDYTISYAHSFETVSVDAGTIIYTFPQRHVELPSTVELYGSVSLDTVPLAPAFTLYVDLDETGKDNATNGVYFTVAGGHSIPFNNPVFTGLDLSGSLGFANTGFSEFYYGETSSGAHDASVTVGLPVDLGSGWSFGAFVTYHALLRDFRGYQYPDPRHVHLGTAGSGSSYADTVYGGFSVSLGF